MPNVGLVILAAGASTRLGRPKQLLSYKGQSLLRHSAEQAEHSVCSPVICVLGFEFDRMVPELDGLDVIVQYCTDWEAGLGASLTSGLGSLTHSVDAVVVMLCDQPLISHEVIDKLVDEFTDTGCEIVASSYADTIGVPALFAASRFTALAALPPNEGARSYLKANSSIVRTIPFPGGETDIDTPGDYDLVLRKEPPMDAVPAL